MFRTADSIPLFVGVFEAADAVCKRLWGVTHTKTDYRQAFQRSRPGDCSKNCSCGCIAALAEQGSATVKTLVQKCAKVARGSFPDY